MLHLNKRNFKVTSISEDEEHSRHHVGQVLLRNWITFLWTNYYIDNVFCNCRFINLYLYVRITTNYYLFGYDTKIFSQNVSDYVKWFYDKCMVGGYLVVLPTVSTSGLLTSHLHHRSEIVLLMVSKEKKGKILYLCIV